jgi:hypothetical protein
MAVPAAVRSYLDRSSSLAKGDRNKMTLPASELRFYRFERRL